MFMQFSPQTVFFVCLVGFPPPKHIQIMIKVVHLEQRNGCDLFGKKTQKFPSQLEVNNVARNCTRVKSNTTSMYFSMYFTKSKSDKSRNELHFSHKCKKVFGMKAAQVLSTSFEIGT